MLGATAPSAHSSVLLAPGAAAAAPIPIGIDSKMYGQSIALLLLGGIGTKTKQAREGGKIGNQDAEEWISIPLALLLVPSDARRNSFGTNDGMTMTVVVVER